MDKEQSMRQFRQLPIIEDETVFEISGKELKAIEAVAEAYSKFIPTVEQIFLRNIMSEKIKIRYEDLEGNEISKEEIVQMFQEHMGKMKVEDTEPNL